MDFQRAMSLPGEQSVVEASADFGARYSTIHQVLHWSSAAIMFAIIPIAWIASSLPEESPPFDLWIGLHEGLGLAVLGLTSFRLFWRAYDRPPKLPAVIPILTRVAAHTVAWGLLIMMILMPLTGYLWTTGHAHDVRPFGLGPFPRVAFGIRALGDTAKTIHVAGQWLVYGLILTHLAGAVRHSLLEKNQLLLRMLPKLRRHIP